MSGRIDYVIVFYYSCEKQKKETVFNGEILKDEPIVTIECEATGHYERAKVEVWIGSENIYSHVVNIYSYLTCGGKARFDFSNVIDRYEFLENLHMPVFPPEWVREPRIFLLP